MALSEDKAKRSKGRGKDDVELAREHSEGISEDSPLGQIQFDEGFSGKVLLGALFVCLIMLPGTIYLGLVAGQSLGAAAQWVTIVLFSEIARRSFMPLKRQEIYCLFYMAGALVYNGFGTLPGLSGGPFASLIATQYIMQSPAMRSVAPLLPHWANPGLDTTAYTSRNLLDPGWWFPIFGAPASIMLLAQIFDRMKWMGLGYVLFRITSDIERLPFPMAPIAASGATALSEASSKEESWRWRIFSVGTVIGLIFGFFYLAVPIFTGVAFGTPVQLLPIPFFDLTQNTERILPTSLIGYNPDLGALMVGFLLPFPIVAGGFISSIGAQVIMNPILYHQHMFPSWVPGSPAIQTNISTNFDFWMSFGIGTQLAIAIIGLVTVFGTLAKGRKKEASARRGSLAQVPAGRGDFPFFGALGAWLLATLGYVLLNHKLVPDFPIWIIVFFALVWTPVNSYVSARMVGLTGNGVSFPFLSQLAVLGAHYTKPDIWFAPLPLNDYGGQAQKFREIELTGTKFTSILKMEVVMLPMILLFSFLYWSFLWKTNPIPSSQFPFAQKMWPISAVQTSIWSQINGEHGATWALNAIKPTVILAGGIFGLLGFGVTHAAGLPVLGYYGFMGGLGAMPHNSIPTFVGAVIGRMYFAKVIGRERWQLYTPVLLAGFACGTGLISMAAIALALIQKTVSYLPF